MFNFAFYSLMVFFIFVCLLLIMIVLIQKGRGGGLASAFGGMGGNTAFGSKTGDVLTWATSFIFLIFLILAVALNLMANARHNANLQATGGGVATTPAAPDANGSTPAGAAPAPIVPLPAPQQQP
jgi:preprotein translocase subunit SecG